MRSPVQMPDPTMGMMSGPVGTGVSMSPDTNTPSQPSYAGLVGPLLQSSLADYNKAAGQKVEAPKVQQPIGKGDLLWALLAAGLPALFAGPRGSRKAKAAMAGLQSFLQMKQMLADKATEQNMAAYKAALEERQAAIDKAKVNIGMDQFQLGRADDAERLKAQLDAQKERDQSNRDWESLTSADKQKNALELLSAEYGLKSTLQDQKARDALEKMMAGTALKSGTPEYKAEAARRIAQVAAGAPQDSGYLDSLAKAAGSPSYKELLDEASTKNKEAQTKRTETLLPLEVEGKKADTRLKNTRADLALKELAAFDSKTAAYLAKQYAGIEQGYMRITQADARNQTTVAKNQAVEVSKYVNHLRTLKQDAQAGIEKTSKQLNDMVAANSNAAIMNVNNPNAPLPYSEADIQAAKNALSAYQTQLKAANEAYTGAREDYDRAFKASQPAGKKAVADPSKWRRAYSVADAATRADMEQKWRTAHPLEPFPWTN